jgi:hypothetical protein
MTAQMKELFARGPRLLMALLIILGIALSSDLLLFEAAVFSWLILIIGVKRNPAFMWAMASGWGFVIVKAIVI